MNTVEQMAIAARSCGYKSSTRYTRRAQFLFEGLDLTGKRVLEVGCGRGAWALWAGICGAEHVLGIDPEVAGSAPGTLLQFHKTIDEVGLTNRIEGRALLVQDLTADNFDIIIAYNVINHFSETHTRTLDHPESRQFFVGIFHHLHRLLRPGGVIIAADCSRRNFFGDLGLPAPMAPTITWDLHQPPELWADIACEAGFTLWDLRWSPVYPLHKMTISPSIAYFLASHFVLRLRKAQHPEFLNRG